MRTKLSAEAQDPIVEAIRHGGHTQAVALLRRWQIALHEAGHVVVAGLAFGSRPEAAIWGCDAGLAFRCGDGPADFGGRSNEAEALAKRIACVSEAGDLAAEMFEDDIPDDLPAIEPSAPRPPAADATPPERQEFAAMFGEPDHVQVMRCCSLLASRAVRRLPMPRRVCSGDVAAQLHWVRRMTARLLRKHGHEIEIVARELFTSGIYTAGMAGKENAMNATKIAEALDRKRCKARAAYYDEMRRARGRIDDAVAGRLVELASEAGIDDAQIQKDAELLEQAAALAETAKAVPDLTKKQAAAVAKAEAAAAELERVTKPLEETAADAAFEAAALDKQLCEVREATRQLAGLVSNYPELLSEHAQLPSVKGWRDANTRRLEREGLAQQLSQLRGRRDRAKLAVDLAEQALGDTKTVCAAGRHRPLRTGRVEPDWQKLEAEAEAVVRDAEAKFADIDIEIKNLEKRLAKLG